MARFDISGSVGRGFSQIDEKSRNIAIRKELEPISKMEDMSMKRQEPPYRQPVPASQELDPLLPAALQTVNMEARRDKTGNVAVYKLPSGDTGGSYEVAGINDKFHPKEAKRLANLPPEQREIEAAKYIRKYTAPIVDKMPEQMQAFVQDMSFNRGAGGATKYIQQGLNILGQKVSVDGVLGPKTLQAIGTVQPGALMKAASQAQLQDEYARARTNPERRKFLQGLENRINNRLSLFGAV
jgi:Predicted Peptidoglycan domain